MLQAIKSDQRHFADHGWLQTNWHFSFSDYYDPANMHWGPLRVFNDDVVQPASGFPMHPHRDMEIITYVIDGELEHRDSMNNRGVVHPGEVQVMSAGTGVLHSEYNPSKTTAVHLLQLWVMPRNKNLAPRWEQRVYDPGAHRGRLVPVVSSGDVDGTLTIDQDTRIYVGKFDAGQKFVHETQPKRHAYLFVIDGDVTLNGTPLSKGDQARIENEPKLDFAVNQDAHVMLLDMA